MRRTIAPTESENPGTAQSTGALYEVQSIDATDPLGRLYHTFRLRSKRMSRFQPATVVPGSRRPWTAFHAKDACPKCGGPMQIRFNAKKRTTFAGCKAYPACNGTIAWNALKKTT